MIYYDLHNRFNQAVMINLSGKWNIVPAPLMFRNFGDGREQVKPIMGGPGQLDRYINLLRVPERHKNIVKVTTICAFDPVIENPIILLAGESGSGKTHQLLLEKSVVDPQTSRMPGLSKNQKEENIKLAMSKHYWYCFDNLKGIPDWFGDYINTVTQGTSEELRQKYTTSNTQVVDIKCVVRMNGITVDLIQSDSLKRSMIIDRDNLEGGAVKEAELFAGLDAIKAELLGEIFTVLSKALNLMDSDTTGRFRMPKDISSRLVDFYELGGAVCEVLQIKDWKDIFKTYAKMQDEIAVNENPIGQAIRKLMEDRRVWVGKASDLYNLLKTIAGGIPPRTVYDRGEYVPVDAGVPGLGINVNDKNAFPSDTVWMMRRYLRPIQGNLREENIFVTLDMKWYEVKALQVSNDLKAVEEARGCDVTKIRDDEKVVMITAAKPFKIPSVDQTR